MIKHSKPFSSITNNSPDNYTINFIKTIYNESFYKENTLKHFIIKIILIYFHS